MKLDLTNGGLPSAHLREHMASGVQTTVYYHVDNGTNIADKYTDADAGESTQPTETPTPTTSPTATPTIAPSATPNSSPTAALPFTLSAEPFADGFEALTFVTNAGDGTGDLYVLEQDGKIWRVAADGTVDHTTPFLDISSEVSCCDERGLLGLAFHPDYTDNQHFYIDYTDTSGNTVISEFGIGADGNADPTSEQKLLGIDQPYPNHNGGMLAFGPDGDLYIGMGDGGSADDPLGNGQSLTTLLGKILRINVDNGNPYSIPQGNPFPVGNHQGAMPEIWDWGMRNPWRFSFDRQTGELWIGDVGQDVWEEVDREAPAHGGNDYGWSVMEATHCFHPAGNCDMTGLTMPVAEYRHGVACAIIGGYVYRGSQYPQMAGQYIFTDLCSGQLMGIPDTSNPLLVGTITAAPVVYGEANITPTSFGEDEAGELYLTSANGQVYKLVAN